MASELDTLTSIEQHGDLNPVQATRLAQLRAAGSAGNPTGVESQGFNFGGASTGTGTGNYSDLVAQQLKMLQQANAPAIASLEASKPEIIQQYQNRANQLTAEQQPLEDRYKNLIDQINGTYAKQVGNTQTATAQEFGRRGISLTSGVYDQTLNQRINPILSEQAGQIKDVGLQQASDIRNLQNNVTNLTDQQVAQLRAVQNAIAQAQSGTSQDAISSALNLYKIGLDQQNALADRQTQTALAQAKAAGVNVPEGSAYIDPTTGKLIYYNAPVFKPTAGAASITSPTTTDWQIIQPTNIGNLSAQTGGNISLPNYAQMTNKFDPLQYLKNPLVGLGIR